MRRLTFELCAEIASKYKTKTEFRLADRSAYQKARDCNWLEVICKHMIPSKNRPHGTLTLEFCKKEALKYKSRSELEAKDKGLYSVARKKGWLDEICSHMVPKLRKLTFELCKQEALKYKTRKELERADQSVFRAIHSNGWDCFLFSHMKKIKYTSWSKTAFKNICNPTGIFYLLYCEDQYEQFYKFGITSRTVKERYYTFKEMPYDYDIILQIENTPTFIWDLEKIWVRETRKYRYTPQIQFAGGSNECFKCNKNNKLIKEHI